MNNEKLVWNYFSEINNAEDLEKYIKNRNANEKETAVYKNLRAYAHSNFFHYTTVEKLEKIFSDNSFLLTRVGYSNDPMEEISKDVYAYHFCLSTGVNENLPLWYLYSGVDGKGARISLTKSKMYKLISEGMYTLVEFDSDVVENGFQLSLNEETDYDLQFQDVVYVKENDKFVDLKYNTMTNRNKIRKDDFAVFKNNNRAFVKSLIWYYEKETRLVVTLKPTIIEKLDVNKTYAIKLCFNHLPEITKNIKLTFAPEFFEDSEDFTYEQVIQSLSSYKNVCNWLLGTSNCSKSEYSGQVKMNLCDKCEKHNS